MSNTRYIFYVGKPYPHEAAFARMKALGFKIGVFLDTQLSPVPTDAYDAVIPLDFAQLEKELPKITAKRLPIAGLLCTYENYIGAKAHIGEYLQLPAISQAAARLCTDKYLMRQAFMTHDPHITPRFGTADSLEAAIALGEELGYPVIIKPTNLVKSLLVLRCNSKEELIENFTYAQAHIAPLYQKYHVYQRPQLIIEQYITGSTCSIAAFVDHTGKPYFCEGIAALKNAQDIGIQDNYLYARYLPAELDKRLEKRLFSVAEKGIEALRLTSSPAHVELIYNDHEVKLIEIGARIGGYRPRMYQLSYGTDLIEQELQLALGNIPHTEGSFHQYSATYELFPETEGHFAALRGSFDPEHFVYFKQKATPGQLIGPAKNGHKAAAIIMAASADKLQFEKLCKEIETISVEVTS